MDGELNAGFFSFSSRVGDLSDKEFAQLQDSLNGVGQGHLLAYFDELDDDERAMLLQQLGMINPASTNQLYDSSMTFDDADSEQGGASDSKVKSNVVGSFTLLGRPDISEKNAKLERVSDCLIAPISSASPEELASWYQAGCQLIKDGEVALVVYAGECILFEDNDKEYSLGMCDVQLPSKKTAFQTLIERFIRAQLVASESKKLARKNLKCKILIMTSHENFAETKKFFKDNKYFGADKNAFTIFCQGMMPQVDLDGKIILSEPHQLQMSANGSGSIFESICNNTKVKNVLSSVKYCQIIDIKCLANTIFDPLMLGYTSNKKLKACLRACQAPEPGKNVSL